MDFSKFGGDWDWTANLADDGENETEATKGFAYSQLSGLVFLLDCGPSMLVKREGDESSFEKCIRCIKGLCQKKIVSSDKDLFAVIFYGLDNPNSEDGKAIQVLQDMGQLNSKRILELEEILTGAADYMAGIKHSSGYDMSDVFWACSNVFAKCNKTFGEKRVLLFTDEDDPHNGDQQLTRKAAAKATDLKGNGIDLELLHLKRDDKPFEMDKFYAAILYDDSDMERVSLPDPAERFEQLLSRVYLKEHKRRALGRIPLSFGSAELSVGVYSLCRRATMPTSVKIHRATNSEVKTLTRVYNKETGEDLMPQDIQHYLDYGGKRICLEPEETRELKELGITGLKLLGFKKISELKLHLHVKPSHFIYPDETVIKGSGRLFSALLARCHARNMAAVCWYRPRSNSPLELAYLLPQAEEKDEHNQQRTPPGFHVIFAPFKEDLRELDHVLEGAPSASTDQVDKCKEFVKKLTFPYEPALFENPVLQSFYSSLEAIALNRDDKPEVEDFTVPKLKKIDKKAGAEIEEFMTSVVPDGYSFTGSGSKRSNNSGGQSASAAKKVKVEPNLDDARELAKSDQLNKLTVAALKELMKKERISTSCTKKADIILAIKDHFNV